ncbi:MAG: hypothetical protein GF329_07895 [Candidatus Lokiarchaeota archaeon]|nr:hypothetical protein [Candidatus Lokiarchaeota archaeon]
MIITHADADGWCSAGIFLLSEISKKNNETIDTIRYATVRYVITLLKQILYNHKPCKIYIFDLNADNTKKYRNLLVQLSRRNFDITLIDHHIVPDKYQFDRTLKDHGITVIRDTSMSCSELIFREYKESIEKRKYDKAFFLMCVGAIGDKRVTTFVQEKLNSFRWENLFDVYAVLVAGIQDGKEFLRSILWEKDKDGVGFTKKIYHRATRKRFWIEKIKKEVLKNLEMLDDGIYVIRIFKKYIGLAASIMVDLPDVDYAIAIGTRSPSSTLNKILLFFRELFRTLFNRPIVKDEKMIRISVRSTKPVNKIITRIANSCNGYGGGHKLACGARIPRKELNLFLKKLVNEIRKS